MEELQSTEILDREILEDARKKAHRILKAADETIKVKSADWEQKLAADISELEKKYAQQGAVATDEIMARLPIDKYRAKSKKMETLLDSAVAHWYASLSRARILDLLKQELAKRLAVYGEIAAAVKIRILICHIRQAEAETIVTAVLPGKSCVIETIHSASLYPELILEIPELRIYASIDKMIAYFLGKKRVELVESLLGEIDREEW